uniref:t-SNARE coiled-coil homology domain-containing protein n=1 Tax=Palpitomonas bilix TaxID=652834 RepID=A0A7S3DI62_9EUKA
MGRTHDDEKNRSALFSGTSRNRPGDRPDGDPEVVKMTMQARKLAGETESTTQRILSRVNEAHSLGTESAVQLKEQREQLYRIEDGLDEIQDNMKTSDRLLRSIKSIGGSIANAFRRKKEKKEKVEGPQSGMAADRLQFEQEKQREREREEERQKAIAAAGGDPLAARAAMAKKEAAMAEAKGEGEGEGEEGKQKKKGGFGSGLKKLFSRKKGEAGAGKGGESKGKNLSRSEPVGLSSDYADQQVHATMKRADDNLDEISRAIGKLKGLALDMGDELTTQNKVIERVAAKTEETDMMVNATNRKMRKML